MEKIQIIILKNIKTFIITSIILISSYFIFYLDLFDLDLFNKKYIENLENELIELKRETNLKSINEIKSETTIYQWISGVALVAGTFLFFYYFYHGGGDNANLLSSPSSTNIYNNLPFEETEIKYSEDPVTRRLDFTTTPSPSPPPKALERYTNDISPLYEKGIKSLHT